jgi:hypothetical protein
VQVGNEDVTRRMPERLSITAVDTGPAAVQRLIPPSCADYKRLVAAADNGEWEVGRIYQTRGGLDSLRWFWSR